MPPGADVVYSVISGGVTLARQVFDRLFTQEAPTHPEPADPITTSDRKSSSGGAEEEEDMEAGADWRPLRRQDHRPGAPLHLLRELGLESLPGPRDGHSPLGRRSQLRRPARVRSDRVPGWQSIRYLICQAQPCHSTDPPPPQSEAECAGKPSAHDDPD